MKRCSLRIVFCIFVVGLLLLYSCVTSQYKPAETMAKIQIKFSDPKWDGRNIPIGQQCNKFGGNGGTPSFLIENIPVETNALIFEYSDRDNTQMNNGGHGKISYTIKPGSPKVTVPSIPGHTFELPDNFVIISAHANPSWDKAGAYMPPCSGGKGHLYYVTVKAVFNAPDKKDSKLLGQGRLDLGRY